jgi:hypothetical protein
MLSSITRTKTDPSYHLLTTKEASQLFPYSREHISRLARENKITGTLINRKWMVCEKSISNFYDLAKIEETILVERLRDERIADQSAIECLYTSKGISAQMHQSVGLYAHAIATFSTAMVALLFFIPTFLVFDFSDQGAAVFHSVDKSGVTTSVLIPIEQTTPLSLTNGIILLAKNSPTTPIDPTTLFSDVVTVVTGDDGVRYVRMQIGDTFSDVPFVHLPTSNQQYQEVGVIDTIPDSF